MSGEMRLWAGTSELVLHESDGVCELRVECEGRSSVLGSIGALDLRERLLGALGQLNSRRRVLGPGEEEHQGVCRCHNSGVGVYVHQQEDGGRQFVALDEDGGVWAQWSLSPAESVLWRRVLRAKD